MAFISFLVCILFVFWSGVSVFWPHCANERYFYCLFRENKRLSNCINAENNMEKMDTTLLPLWGNTLPTAAQVSSLTVLHSVFMWVAKGLWGSRCSTWRSFKITPGVHVHSVGKLVKYPFLTGRQCLASNVVLTI